MTVLFHFTSSSLRSDQYTKRSASIESVFGYGSSRLGSLMSNDVGVGARVGLMPNITPVSVEDQNYKALVAASNPAAYVRMDHATADTFLFDESKNGNAVNRVASVSATHEQPSLIPSLSNKSLGVVTNSSQCTGAITGSYTFLNTMNGNSANLQLSNNFTVESWVKFLSPMPTSPQQTTQVIARHRQSTGNGYALWVDTSTGSPVLKLDISGVTRATYSGLVGGNTYYIAASFGSNTARLYVNGQDVTTAVNTTTGILADNTGLAVGATYFGGYSASTDICGGIDESAVYGSVLSGQTIFDRWTQGSKPLANKSFVSYPLVIANSVPSAYYRFSETSGPNVADTSGNNTTAAVIGTSATRNNAPLVNGSPDPSLLLQGPSINYVSVPTIPALSRRAHTVEMWVDLKAINNRMSLLYKHSPSLPTQSMSISLDRVDSASANIRVGRYGMSGISVINSVGAPVKLGINYIVYTRRNGVHKLYVNGVDVTSTVSQTNFITPAEELAPLVLGVAGAANNVDQLPGAIDDVAFYPNALSAAEVVAHWDLGKGASGAPVAAAAGPAPATIAGDQLVFINGSICSRLIYSAANREIKLVQYNLAASSETPTEKANCNTIRAVRGPNEILPANLSPQHPLYDPVLDNPASSAFNVTTIGRAVYPIAGTPIFQFFDSTGAEIVFDNSATSSSANPVYSTAITSDFIDALQINAEVKGTTGTNALAPSIPGTLYQQRYLLGLACRVR